MLHGIPEDDLILAPTPIGEFAVLKDDDMGIYLQEPGGYEPEVMRVVQALPRMIPAVTGGTVMRPLVAANVGANIGYFGRALAERLREPPWLVEPFNANAILLYENVPACKERIIRCAASDYNGTGMIAAHPTNHGDNRLQPDGEIPVNVRRMDDLLPRIDFAIIDAQGHDAVIVAGWQRRLPRVLIVEHAPDLIRWAGGRNPDEDLNLYRELGFTIDTLQHPDPEKPDVNLLLVRERRALPSGESTADAAPEWAAALRALCPRKPAA